MKKVLVLVAGLVASSASMAEVVTQYSDTQLQSAEFSTKAEAYQAGFEMRDSLTALNSTELESKLVVSGDAYRVRLDDTKVEVEEFANANDQIVYRANVDVNYHYNFID